MPEPYQMSTPMRVDLNLWPKVYLKIREKRICEEWELYRV